MSRHLSLANRRRKSASRNHSIRRPCADLRHAVETTQNRVAIRFLEWLKNRKQNWLSEEIFQDGHSAMRETRKI